MTTPADNSASASPDPHGGETGSATPSDAPQVAPGTIDQGKRDLTISLNPRSVTKSGIILGFLGAAFLLGLWLFSVTSHFLFLIMLAWLFAAALEPGIRALIARGRSRGLGAAIMGGGAIVAMLILGIVFGDLFFTQMAQFVASVPALATSAVDWVNSTFNTSFDPNAIISSLSVSPSQVASSAESLSGGLLGVVASLSAVMFDLVTVLVFGFYFAADGPAFFRTIASWMPHRGQQVFLTISEITVSKTGGYVLSKIILAALSATFHGILFALIGVPYWLPFALFVGITAQFVPLVGTYIGIALPVAATVFETPWKAIVIVVFAAIYQQIETYFFTPRVSKRTMDVNPAIALAAVFVGGAIWGPLGALIGIPLAAAGVAILDTYKQRYDLLPQIDTGVGLSGGTPQRG